MELTLYFLSWTPFVTLFKQIVEKDLFKVVV